MKALACLILCFAPLAIASGGRADAPVPGRVTLVHFWAAWCGPCRVVTPALQQMADTDADIALRRIDLTDARSDPLGGIVPRHSPSACEGVQSRLQSGRPRYRRRHRQDQKLRHPGEEWLIDAATHAHMRARTRINRFLVNETVPFA